MSDVEKEVIDTACEHALHTEESFDDCSECYKEFKAVMDKIFKKKTRMYHESSHALSEHESVNNPLE